MKNTIKKRYTNKVGIITLDNCVVVSDPCYDYGIWCSKDLAVKGGIYNCYFTMKDCGAWGWRVAKITIKLKGYSKVNCTELCDYHIGVDSGQCGFYDAEYFKTLKANKVEEEKWYNDVCDATIGDKYGIFDFKSFVTSSGYGDGGYSLFVGKYNGEIVALEVRFM